MKCKHLVDGQICGSEIPPLAKWCGFCGGQVIVEDDISCSKACPNCSAVVTKGQKFCTECRWKVDPSIFLSLKVICQGQKEDGQICGTELLLSNKFCAECGTPQNKPRKADVVAVESITEVKNGDVIKNEQTRPAIPVGETSNSVSIIVAASVSDGIPVQIDSISDVKTGQKQDRGMADSRTIVETENQHKFMEDDKCSVLKNEEEQVLKNDESKLMVITEERPAGLSGGSGLQENSGGNHDLRTDDQCLLLITGDGSLMEKNGLVKDDNNTVAKKTEEKQNFVESSSMLNKDEQHNLMEDSCTSVVMGGEQLDKEHRSLIVKSTRQHIENGTGSQSMDVDIKDELVDNPAKVSSSQDSLVNVGDQAVHVDQETNNGFSMQVSSFKSNDPESQILPTCEQIVIGDTGGTTMQDVMRNDAVRILNDQDSSTLGINTQDILKQLSTLSESGNPVSSPESTVLNTEDKNESEQGIQPHFMMTHSNVQELYKMFGEVVTLKIPVVESDPNVVSLATSQDNVNNNASESHASTDSPKADDEISVKSQMDSEDSDSGSDEKDEDTTQTSKLSKSKKNKLKKKKREEQKKKERKKRKENRGKPDQELYNPSAVKREKRKNQKYANTTQNDQEQSVAVLDKLNNNERQDTCSNIQNAEKVQNNSNVTSGQTYAEAASTNISDNKGVTVHSKDHIDVCFHAIFSKAMFENLETDKVYIVFDYAALGSWKKQYQLKGIQTYKDEYILFTTHVDIPQFVANSPYYRVSYCYVVLHGSSGETIEHVPFSQGASGTAINRVLTVPYEDIKKGYYHRYDGIVRPNHTKHKNFFQSVKDKFKKGIFGIDEYKDMLREDATFSATKFLPLWQLTSTNANGMNGDEMICHTNCIVNGLREVYHIYAGLWNDIIGFDRMITGVLTPSIQSIVASLADIGKENLDEDSQLLRLVTAVTVTCLVETYNVDLGVQGRIVLCNALLPKPNFKKKVCLDVDGLNKFFPETFSKVADQVLKFSRSIANKTEISIDKANPGWFYCLPILHFLQKKCLPFEEPPAEFDHDARIPKWWGIDDFKSDVDAFKAKTVTWERLPLQVLEKLSPYFKVDYYLARSFTASLKMEYIPDILATGLIPTDVVLAVICYYMRTTRSMTKDYRDAYLLKLYKQAIKQTSIEDDNARAEVSLNDAYRCMRISADVVQESLDSTANRDLRTPSMEVFLLTLDLFDKMQVRLDFQSTDVRQLKIVKDEHLTLFYQLCGNFCEQLVRQTFYNEEFKYLQVWNAAFKVSVPSGTIRDHFLKQVEETLRSELNKKGTIDKLIKIYLTESHCFEGPVQSILGEVALKAIEKCGSFDMKIVHDDTVLMRLGDLLSSVLEKSWDRTQRGNSFKTLEHALSWSPFPTFMEMYYKFSNSLKGESLGLLHESIMVLEEKLHQLSSGEIMTRDLKILQDQKDNFRKIVSVMKDVDASKTMKTLAIREKELQAYLKTLPCVQQFLYFCIQCKADTSHMDEKIKRLENLDTIPLSHLVKTVASEELQNFKQYKPLVIIFELKQEELDILLEIIECSRSVLFTKFWEARGIELKKEKNRKLTIQEVLEEVWTHTSANWKEICQKLKIGSLLFTEFDLYFGKTETSNLRDELNLLANDGKTEWVNERMDQIKKYRDLQDCMVGAEVILEVVETFELKGNFKQIQYIHRLTMGDDMRMNRLDKSLLETCSILRQVTKERVECLKTFIKCKPLVDWLKESMPSGLKELKVFVDLASISAGEGDMEIDKVNCLHSATTGYAPLIFNLEKECDTKMFLDKCQEVWKELAANPHLPDKLISTNEQLTWLQTVQKSHGSVEVSSLAQAEAINSKGIYQVGNLSKSRMIGRTTLTEVMELHVAEEEGKVAHRSYYKYEQLHDLQSRLMLVAGKAVQGKDEVDRFMLILDAVVRLGNIYTKLLEEGCVLFSQWQVKFLCDKKRRACAVITFGYGEERQILKGRIDEEHEDVSYIIPKLAKFLELCHEKWLNYIDKKREEYYCLNYFTIDQMVILQQELVKLGSSQEPSVAIYPLLSAVKKDCTKEDLVRAMSAAKSDVTMLDTQRQIEAEAKSSEEEVVFIERADEEKIGRFLKEMTTAGYPEGLAKEALKYIEPDDIDGGIVWCMDNEDEYKPEADNVRINTAVNIPEVTGDEESVVFEGWTLTNQSLSSVTGRLVDQLSVGTSDNTLKRLIKALEDLWQTFLTSISSSVSDYLSVEHLGMILNRLAEQETFKVNRTFLPCFKAGEPNLIICPQSEIYNTVLSVYSHEDDRPLPQSDEVLLCTPHTTLDMLEIFWRRALYAENNKIHCLVNADLLDYDVSDRGEKSLEIHMKNAESKGKGYSLVVICSSENEYKSRIVAALDKYHRPQLTTDVATVRKYLLTKLKVDKLFAGIRPASTVDFEWSSVRVVKSWRAGVGKSLYKKRMVAQLHKLVQNLKRRQSSNVTIPLHEKTVNIDSIMEVLLQQIMPPRCHEPRIFHIDISHEVQEGVDALLFQLLVLGCLGHSSGQVWRRSERDYYIIESMPLLVRDTDTQGGKLRCLHHCLDILPHVTCRSPHESLDILCGIRRPPDYTDNDRLFDNIEFKSAAFQRPYQYLKRLDTHCRLDGVNPKIPEGDKQKCLKTLLRHCGIKDPSWSELHHFVSFLNKQLQDFEVSAFCGPAAREDLPGFDMFVLICLIQMSRDFSTRSLIMSEESPIQMLQRQVMDEEEEETGEDVLQLYQMRRTWETSPHPYLFFNPDQHSMAFLGFNIQRRTGNLVDQQTGKVLEQGIMHPNLFDALVRNRVNLAENFDALPRHEKIMKLCQVMGLDMPHDPDETYELTTDNVKKILAIYMRFRCEIPVIIMGETGCGKTRLIKFMCCLQAPPGVNVENMILMKVHGGTKASDIERKVRKAEEIAQKNAAQYPQMDTVLFFDEANTTESIGVIKEIVCDKSLGGQPIKLHEKLKIVAACNPYRKHSDELIRRLEQAGLGYHVNADKTTDKLGRVPMRRLVYRVQPLPQSMLPLVWDFGQLDTDVEEMYIRQMVLRYINNQQLPTIKGLETTVSKILTVSQNFMRQQKDECSFVSLRDVERVLQVMSWFYRQSENDELLFQKIRDESDYDDSESEEESLEIEDDHEEIDDVTRSLVLALGICYHACLKNRKQYRDTVATFFTPPLRLTGGGDQIEEEISKCQSVFLDNVKLAPNIAKNQALKENVFMMVVCIELRIPMFLVGKPGSSKSLAKTIVADAMQGNAAHKELFKNYKQVQMVSFQCSPLSTPDGIMGTFRQCAAYQKDKNLDRFVSIVVLDEIGLAEDSPKMPLKTLHPLLEDGCPDDEDPEPHKKVAFIGISNWALDPAKMNRGILVQREVPDEQELINSAHGICSTDDDVLNALRSMIPSMASSYLKLFDETSTEMREFFGLRDFYSLVKMLFAFVKTSGHKPTWPQLKHSILRNFGGLENVEPVDVFYQNLSSFIIKDQKPSDTDPDCTPYGMIQACLKGDSQTDSESRYLLLLTENYGALTILQQKIFTMENAVVIFGSSFPSDQEYTQVCRNINRIKVCMETGSTVILLNLENLYESLYDALNQYYVRFGGEKYVDLGLGTHRVKCRVHEHFRLIVVAEKQIVYNKFPIPLINRLEKHFLSLKTMLTPEQLELTDKLQKWAHSLCENKSPAHYAQRKVIRKIGDAFMGYHDDTCAAIILHVCQEKRCDDQAIPEIEKEILTEAQSIMLWCATPAAVWEQEMAVFSIYFREQHHDSLVDYLHYKMVDQQQHNIHAQITTNSKLLSTADIEILCRFIPIQRQNVTLLTLQSFDTEQQFSRKVRSCFDQSDGSDILLIVQCDSGDQNADLIACARYTVQGELQVQGDRTYAIHVVFLIQLPGIAGGCFTGFQCGLWHSVHIDDLHPSPEDIPSVADMHGKTVSALLCPSKVTNHHDNFVEEQENQMGKQDDVSLEDINFEETTLDKIVCPKRHFDINHLILNCVQPALARVKDLEKDSNRGTGRLKIVLNLLNNTTGIADHLLDGIAFHLMKILSEKEESVGGHLTANWLSTETGNINRAGTFRRFAVHCLHAKVIPILASIIAFIDTNRNLDILTRSDHQSWKFDLWLQIFSNSEITQLKYSNVVSPTRQSELQEVIVKSTSLEGKVFSAVLPFSWLIFRQIDDILKTVKETEGLKDLNFDVVMKAAELLGDLPLGKLLNGFHGDVNMAILQLYTTDFVHMVYPVQTESECKIICENVMIGCRQLIRGEFGRLLPSLFGFHMTYILYAARFKNFSYMVSVWPECSQRVMDFQEHKSMYLVTDEEICLDVLALHLLTKNLEPREDELNSPASRIKWLRQVCDYRPIVERILGLGDAKNCQFGERCKRGIQEARHQWTRAIVVKLFIEHVCTENRAESEIKRCRPLWVALGNETDMKNKESLEVIEKFLRGCNRKIVASYFGKDVRCSSCENHVEGAPVTLPCQHVVCRKCFEDFKTLSELECTQCHVPFPADFNPDVEPGKGGNITKYQDYRRRCNTFFMEIVSQLCFAEGTPPSHDVIQKLLSYITGERRGRGGARIVSRDLTIFEDSFDPTPVVRSFLLQQLMQTSGEEVDRYLETYFNHTSKLLGTEDQKQLVELCLLVLQCLEDSHHQQNSRRSHVSDSLQYTDSTSTEDETIIVKDVLTAASQQIFTDTGTLECIKYIASVRFALSVVAKYIHHMYGSTQKTIKLNSNIRRMFAAAAQLCEDCGSPWPKNYFIKQLCRCYSIDSYYSVLTKKDVSFLSWVQLPQINVEQVNDCFDRYIMCGQEYQHIRETVLQTLMNEEGTEINGILQKIPIESEWQTRVNLMLAIHRLITMSYVKEEEHQTVSAEGKAYFVQLITNNWTRPKDKALTIDMLQNTMWKLDQDRNINVDMDLAQQNISCLLTHFLILMSEIPGKTTLVTPLQLLSLQPQRMRNSFYPTMPEDEVADVREALLAARRANPNENPVFYRCPNGHPYVIGDCGRPQVEHKCNVCGKQIGGTKHVLRPDNEKDQGKDRTETGHILGRATTLGPVVAPERKLNRASFAILRLLTHVSMYVGANVNAEAVVDSIKPDIEQEDLASYLMEHIELDLTMIQSAVGKNKDDVLVLIHYILSRVMEVHTTAVIGGEVPEDICRLTNRDGRAKWEKLFVEMYITPVLQDIDSVVTTWNDRIINDRKLGSDHLLQILYEKNAVETESLDNLWDIPAVWRYKARISVDHLMQTLNISKQKCPVLRLFLKEEYHLRVIRFAPSILRLQKLLIQKYNKKLDRTEANLLKLENVKENMHQDGKLEKFESLLADFIEAWDCVRESLETYVCPANQTVISVNREYCKTRITDSTPVSYLLPTYKDTGLCSFVLLYFLMDKQNIFLGNYCHRRNISEDSLPKVHVKDISSAHLISYHPDRDLLPMVLANCNYSFEVGQGTRVDYNVTNLERQLMDRFLFSKSFISHIQEIETFTHRAESTNAVVFKVLSQRIKQERLHQSVQSQIHRELHAKAYPDLCESLDKLDIAISFLKSVGSDPDSSLYDFMTNTLKMDSAFPSPKAQQVSKCKHTMSWWVTLALERAKRLTKHKQEVFEGLSENLKEDLNEEQKKVTEEIVNSLPLEHIDILVTLVFECIVLKIDIPQNKDEDDYVDMSNISLHDTLTAYISASPYDEDKLVDQILITAIGKLPTDPQDQNRIMTGQSVSFWKFINRLLVSKQQQRL